jgi:hypothetical protein
MQPEQTLIRPQNRRFSLAPVAAAAAAGLPLLFAASAVSPLLLCARPALAQDAPGDVEAAKTSSVLAGLTLPAGAYRSTSRDDIAKFADTLGRVAQEGEGTIGKVEVLVWRGGSDWAAQVADGRAVQGRLQTQRATRGQGGISTITLFGAAKAVRTDNVIGMWIAKDNLLLLAWGAFVPNSGGKSENDGAGESGAKEDKGDAAPAPRRKTNGRATRNKRRHPPPAAPAWQASPCPKEPRARTTPRSPPAWAASVADGAKEFKLPPRPGGPGKAEVYFWTGSAYKPGRAPFMRTLLQNALTEAGYDNYKLVDPSMDNTPNAFKDYEYGTGALDFVPADARHLYFYATSAKTGKSVVGAWFDQESKNRLVLVLGEAGTVSAPAETKIPTFPARTCGW